MVSLVYHRLQVELISHTKVILIEYFESSELTQIGGNEEVVPSQTFRKDKMLKKPVHLFNSSQIDGQALTRN